MFILGYEPTKKMLENISKINYLCDIKEVWSNFVIIYVLLGLLLLLLVADLCVVRDKFFYDNDIYIYILQDSW